MHFLRIQSRLRLSVSLQHLRLRGFGIGRTIHRVVVEITRSAFVEDDVNRDGVGLPVLNVGTAGGDASLANKAEVRGRRLIVLWKQRCFNHYSG